MLTNVPRRKFHYKSLSLSIEILSHLMILCRRGPISREFHARAQHLQMAAIFHEKRDHFSAFELLISMLLLQIIHTVNIYFNFASVILST